jgi:hypothetical protein
MNPITLEKGMQNRSGNNKQSGATGKETGPKGSVRGKAAASARKGRRKKRPVKKASGKTGVDEPSKRPSRKVHKKTVGICPHKAVSRLKGNRRSSKATESGGKVAGTSIGSSGGGGKARLVSILMVASAIIFNLYITSPLFSEGVNDAGDDQYHLANTYYMRKLILEERMIFGVVETYGTGYPWFNAHQFLMYLAVVALNLLSFQTMSLLTAYKLLIVLLYSLFPLGVYYLLDKYGKPPILCGLGALLAPLPISGWGQSISSYFSLGLVSQLPGALLFPFALGSFHQLICRGEGVRKTALLYVLTSFAHPYYGYFLVFVSSLDVVVFLVKRNKSQVASALKHAFFAGSIALLLTLFWIMPIQEFLEYIPRTMHLQAVKLSFSAESAFTGLLTGEVLDVSDNFGDAQNKNLRWPVNKDRGRLPVLTALTVAGLVYALVRRDRFSVFCVSCFIVAFILLIGSDDVVLLKYLPFSEYANAKRTIYVFEFFSICLSAQLLYWVMSSAYSSLRRVVAGDRFRLAVALALLLAVLYTPYNERLLTAEKEVNTFSYFMPSFNAIRVKIKEDGMDGRVYGESETGLKSPGIVLSQAWLLDTPSMRRIYSTRFRGDLLNQSKKINLFHIFNIRYLLTATKYEIPEDIRPMFTELYSDNFFRLYRVEGNHSYAFFSLKKPALLTAEEKGWRRIAEVWLYYYKKDSKRDDIPLMVHYLGQDIKSSDYSQLIKYDMEPEEELISLFNGDVFNGTEQPHNTVRAAIKDKSTAKTRPEVNIISRRIHRLLVKVKTDNPGLLIHKVRYHPNWKVKVDGREKDTLRVIPEYPGVFVPKGEHLVEFRYRQPTKQKIYNIISFMTLLYVLVPASILSKMKNGLQKMKESFL